LALLAGVDRTVVSKIERGVTNPSQVILLRLATPLDVEVGHRPLPLTDYPKGKGFAEDLKALG